METLSAMIAELSRAGDRYGAPYLTGFMDRYGLKGLCECYDDPEAYERLAAEYIREQKIK